jgi:hypothetical protein
MQCYSYRSNSFHFQHGIHNVCCACRVSITAKISSTDGQANGDILPADKTFTMQLAVQGMIMGKYPFPLISKS